MVSESCSVVSNSLWRHGPYSPWNSPGQNTGVGSLFLLQGIFPTQGSNPGLLHCRQILYPLSHQGSPRRLEWVAYIFSSGSSRPRNWTRVSCIAGRFFTNWAIRGAIYNWYSGANPSIHWLTHSLTHSCIHSLLLTARHWALFSENRVNQAGPTFLELTPCCVRHLGWKVLRR